MTVRVAVDIFESGCGYKRMAAGWRGEEVAIKLKISGPTAQSSNYLGISIWIQANA